MPLARLVARPAARLVPPLPALLHLADVHADGAALADDRRLGLFRVAASARAPCAGPRGWNLVGVVAGKAFFVTWAIAIPLLVYPWWEVRRLLVDLAVLTSLIMATTFQLAHCVEEAEFSIVEPWARRAHASGPCTRSRRRSTSARATAVLTW